MWCVLSAAARLLVAVAAVLIVVAILLGRATPERPDARVIAPDRLVAINRGFVHDWRRGAWFYDPGTGRQGHLALTAGQTLDHASLSPWRSESGQRQVVGLWAQYTEMATGYVLNDAALARLSFPEGRILDRVPIEVNPIGPPCWYPDTSARVLFPAADGRLYH